MNVLAIDTVTEICSVAIGYQGEMKQAICAERAGHSKRILEMIENLCREFDINLSDLDVIAVDTGPGSFTGVRIGIGVAQGLAYGAGLSVIGIGSLEVLAASVEDTLILPALDARMGQIYFAMYELKSDGCKELVSPSVDFPSAFHVPDVSSSVIGLGSGWDQYSEEMLQSLKADHITWRPDCYPQARYLIEVARKYGVKRAATPLDLQASYVRDKVVN